MKISKLARRAAKQLFRSCLSDGVLDENRARAAVRQLVKVKPRGYLAILVHFQRLVKLDVARRSARIESAVPLPPDLQARVQSSLARVYGPALNLSFEVNPALIGGMRIKVGSDVYDGTIRGRLAALEERF